MVALIIGYGYCILTRLLHVYNVVLSLFFMLSLSLLSQSTVDVYGREVLRNL